VNIEVKGLGWGWYIASLFPSLRVLFEVHCLEKTDDFRTQYLQRVMLKCLNTIA